MKTKATKDLSVGYPSINEPNEFVIKDSDGIIYAKVYGANGTVEDIEEAEANAKLIAAAHDLLNALDIALNALWMAGVETKVNYPEIEQAIKKATA